MSDIEHEDNLKPNCPEHGFEPDIFKGLDRLPPNVRMRRGSQHSGVGNEFPLLRTRSAGSPISVDENPRSILRTRSSGSQIADADQPPLIFRARSDSARSRASFADFPPTLSGVAPKGQFESAGEAGDVRYIDLESKAGAEMFHRTASAESQRSSRRSSGQTR